MLLLGMQWIQLVFRQDSVMWQHTQLLDATLYYLCLVSGA